MRSRREEEEMVWGVSSNMCLSGKKDRDPKLLQSRTKAQHERAGVDQEWRVTSRRMEEEPGVSFLFR